MRIRPTSSLHFAAFALLSAPCCLQSLGQPATTPGLIANFQYADDAAAQRAWQPMRGSLPVFVATNEARRVLRLPCNFENTKTERASWDSPVKLDLSSGRGVRFDLFCRNTSPVSYFSIYFQSGDGWYHATFFPESTTGWNTITVDKKDMSTEGQPAGWANIKTIRFSAWRGQDTDTEFYLRDLRQVGVLGVDAEVAILRGAAAQVSSPQDAREPEQYAEAIARHLHTLDVGCAILGESAVTAESLRSARVVILPFNPNLPDRTADELVRYVARGGKVLAFYTLPKKLLPALNLGDGKHIAADAPAQVCHDSLQRKPLPGAPTVVTQQSWNINALQPLAGKSRVVAEWFDAERPPHPVTRP